MRFIYSGRNIDNSKRPLAASTDTTHTFNITNTYHIKWMFDVFFADARNMCKSVFFNTQSTKHRSQTLRTVPCNSIPICKSSSFKTSLRKIGLSKLSRGSRSGATNASKISLNVYSPTSKPSFNCSLSAF